MNCSLNAPSNSYLLSRSRDQIDGMLCVASPNAIQVFFSVMFLLLSVFLRFIESFSVFFGHGRTETEFDVANPWASGPPVVLFKLLVAIVHFFIADRVATGVFSLIGIALVTLNFIIFLPYKLRYANRVRTFQFSSLLSAVVVAFDGSDISLYLILPISALGIVFAELLLRLRVKRLLARSEIYFRQIRREASYGGIDPEPALRGKFADVPMCSPSPAPDQPKSNQVLPHDVQTNDRFERPTAGQEALDTAPADHAVVDVAGDGDDGSYGSSRRGSTRHTRCHVTLQWWEVVAASQWYLDCAVHQVSRAKKQKESRFEARREVPKDVTDRIELIKSFYEDCVDSQPDNALLRLHAVEFLLSMSNAEGSLFGMAVVQEVLTDAALHLNEMSTRAKISWIALDDMRRSLDSSGSAELTLYLRKSTKHLLNIIRLTAVFWELLLQEKPNVETLGQVVRRIEREEAQAQHAYRMMLVQYPTTPSVLRSYAHFLEVTSIDMDESAHYYALAERSESRHSQRYRSLKTGSVGMKATMSIVAPSSKSHAQRPSGSSSPPHISSDDLVMAESGHHAPARAKGRSVSMQGGAGFEETLHEEGADRNPVFDEQGRKRTMEEQALLDLHGDDKSSSSSNLFAKSDADYELRDDLRMFLTKRSSAYKVLTAAIWVSLLCVLAIGISVFVVSNGTLSSSDGQLVADAGEVREPVVTAAFMVRMVEVTSLNVTGVLGLNGTYARTAAVESADSLDNAVSVVYKKSWGNTMLIDKWMENSVPIVFFNPVTKQYGAYPSSREFMFGVISRGVRNSVALSESFYQNPLNTGNATEFLAVVMNGPNVFLGACQTLVDVYVDVYRTRSTNDQNVLWILGSVALAVPILLFFCVFWPATYRIREERRSINKLFLLIPKTEVALLLRSVKVSLTSELSRDFARANDRGDVPMDAASQGSSKDSASIILRDARGQASSKSAFVVLAICFGIAIAAAGTFIFLMSVFSVTAIQQRYGDAALINYAGYRKALARKVVFYANELIRFDTRFPWASSGTRDELRGLIIDAVTELKTIHEGVKYGSSKMETPASVGRNSHQDALLFSARCANKNDVACMSMDELLRTFFLTGQYFAYTPESDLSYSHPDFTTLVSIMIYQLDPLLDQSKQLYVTGSSSTVDDTQILLNVLFSLTVVVVIVSLAACQVMLFMVWKEMRQNRKMLAMVPVLVMQRVPALELFIRSHGAKLDKQFVQDAVRESEEKTLSVLEASVDGVFSLNENGIIERVSPAAEKMFMCGTSSFIGRPFEEFVDHLRDFTGTSGGDAKNAEHTADMRLREVLKDLLSKSKASSETANYEARGRRPGSAEEFPVQISITARHIRKQGYFAAFVRDLTFSRRQEALLRSERQRSDDLLLNILPRSIAVRLKNNEQPIYDSYPSVTLCFIDMVKFTEMSSKMTPRELIVLLSDVFSHMDALCAKHRIEKIKLIGDCFFGAAGLFERVHDHALAMVEFGRDVFLMLDKFNKERGTTLQMRMGINSGPVMAGVIGTTKFAFDLFGDAVNVASRMESNGVAGKIHISRNTYELVWDKVQVEDRGMMSIKGKGEMQTFLVKDVLGAESGSISTPL
eukprot:ANDGO_00640.mRNA.1 Adenylate cyclase